MGKGKATPSKPELPKAPKRPRLTMNENTNAVRKAEYAKEKAAYDAAILHHQEAMHRRGAAKRSVQEQFDAAEAAAAEADDAPKQERPPRRLQHADFEAQARHPVIMQHSLLTWEVPAAYREGRTCCIGRTSDCNGKFGNDREGTAWACTCGMITAQRLATQEAW